jgi:hypothetical protein
LLALLTEPEETAKETNKKINENDNVEAAAGIAGIHHAILRVLIAVVVVVVVVVVVLR